MKWISNSNLQDRWQARLAASTALGLAATALFVAACGDGTTDPDPPDNVNRPPVANGTIPPQTVNVDETVAVGLSNYFSDPDNDALTYSAQTSNSGVASVSVSGSNAVVNGVSRGEATITVTATDPDGLSAQQSFAVEVPNRAPEAVGVIADLELLAGDTVEINVSGNFADPDGDALTYSAATSDAGVAAAAVQGATVTVIAVSDGDASLTVTANDAGGLSAEQNFAATVDPAGDPRIQFVTEPVTVLEGGTIVVEVEARPPPESALDVSYSIGGDDDPRTDDADESDHNAGIRGTVQFEAGSRRATLEITVRDDADAEPTREVLNISLDTPTEGAGYLLGSTNATWATIEEGVCDRTPRIRDELMAHAGVGLCHVMDAAHLAPIDTLDLRGPDPDGLGVASDLRGLDETQSRTCGPRKRSASPGRSTGLPVVERAECMPVPHARVAPAPPPSTTITGTDDALTELRAGDFLELTGLKELWLFDNELTELPDGIFSDLTDLRVLILDRNRLKELPDGLLSELFRLEVFAVPSNELTRLPPDLFSGLSRLEGVWLSHNQLDELPTGLFSDLHNLEELYLEENRLDALPAGVFAELDQLRILSLGTNRLTALDAAVFSALGDLEDLDLLSNRLIELPPGVFANLGSLERLSLRDNRLAELPPGVFADLGSLEAIYLGDNQLQRLPNGLFDGPSGLATLDLEKNQIAEIASGTFSGLSGIEQIQLNDNHLAVLENGAFSGLSGLEGLFLQRNRLVELELEVFSGLSRLEALWLAENRITDLEPGVFDGLSRLQQLTLGQNAFTELKAGVFADLSRLDELWLEAGELIVVRPGALNGLTDLKGLYLQENQLTKLETGSLAGLPALTELWIYSNQLTELSEDVFAELPLLRRLVMWGNRLTELPSGVFSDLIELEQLELAVNQIANLPGGVFSNLTALKDLKLQSNNLAELPDSVFTGLSDLASLNLDFNPGTPFTLDVQLERTDTTDLAAPGPATVMLSLAEGAPFSMTIPLSVEGGSLSTTTAVIEQGKAASAEFTVTMSSGSTSGTEVVVGPAPLVPDAMIGVHLVAADTLLLFTTSGDLSGAEPIEMSALTDGQAPVGNGATPVMLVAGLLGSAGWRLRPRSKDTDARSRTGCSAGAGRCTPAGRERSAGGRAWSTRAVERAP